jgi:hypothetical protein
MPLPPAVLARAGAGGPRAYRWSLIYARITACDEQCVADLDRLRRVHLALGDDHERVARLYLHTAGAARPLEDHALKSALLDERADDELLERLGRGRLASGRIYIADPMGNLIVSYPADVDLKELERDFSRLLDPAGAAR